MPETVDANKRKALAEANLVKAGRYLAELIRKSVPKKRPGEIGRAAWWTLATMTETVCVELGMGEKAVFSAFDGFQILDDRKTHLCLAFTSASLGTIEFWLKERFAVDAHILVPDVNVALVAVEKILPFLNNSLFSAWICRPDSEKGIVRSDAHAVVARLARLALKKGGPKKAAKGNLQMYRLFKECIGALVKGIV